MSLYAPQIQERINYGQSMRINGLAGAVSMAGSDDGLWVVEGGNWSSNEIALASCVHHCYDDLNKEGYGTESTTLSTTLFKDGYGCSSCYEIKCVNDPEWCNPGQPSIFVTGTDFCPPNYALPSNNRGWCTPPNYHFDLSKTAFLEIAEYKAGIVTVQYRRVPCNKQGRIIFTISGNPYYNKVLIWNVAGSGDIKMVRVKGSQNLPWANIKRDWGQYWITDAKCVGESLTFKVIASDGRSSTSWHVTHENWQFGQTFQGKNFK